MKREIARRWEGAEPDHQLTVETEVFWRRGSPP
jgi:hypothetical protein